jgi:hypothetical protein
MLGVEQILLINLASIQLPRSFLEKRVFTFLSITQVIINNYLYNNANILS